eukprot:gene3990-8417_t
MAVFGVVGAVCNLAEALHQRQTTNASSVTRCSTGGHLWKFRDDSAIDGRRSTSMQCNLVEVSAEF